MSYTVKERIERRIVALLGGLEGLSPANVQRWDMHGNERRAVDGVLPEAWAVLEPGEESATDEETNGLTECRLPLSISLHLTQSEDSPVNTSEAANDWLGRLEVGLPLEGDQYLAEVDGTQLAHRIRKVGSDAYKSAVKNQGETVIVLFLDIDYRHPLGDPYSVA